MRTLKLYLCTKIRFTSVDSRCSTTWRRPNHLFHYAWTPMQRGKGTIPIGHRSLISPFMSPRVWMKTLHIALRCVVSRASYYIPFLILLHVAYRGILFTDINYSNFHVCTRPPHRNSIPALRRKTRLRERLSSEHESKDSHNNQPYDNDIYPFHDNLRLKIFDNPYWENTPTFTSSRINDCEKRVNRFAGIFFEFQPHLGRKHNKTLCFQA
jgi:hypothetical protein